MKAFSGAVTVAVEVEPQVAHAIKNVGDRDVTILSCTDLAYDPAAPDVTAQILA